MKGRKGREQGREEAIEGGREGGVNEGGVNEGGKREKGKKWKKEEREGTNPWMGRTRAYRPGVLGLLAGFVGLIGRSADLLFSRV